LAHQADANLLILDATDKENPMKNPMILFKALWLPLCCLALSPMVQAVRPPPDGGYAGFNTAEGQNALFSLTTGVGNTAVGWFSLWSNAGSSYNTAVGAGALVLNMEDGNTAIGAAALFSNTTGFQNAASGAFALLSNTTGSDNTANGFSTLYSNTTGFNNTAIGFESLYSNTTGTQNTAIGRSALGFNTTGSDNNALGVGALDNNATGESNVAIGTLALQDNASGDSNTAIGDSAGSHITGDGNVCIGAGVNGVAGESNITRIRNIYESVATERSVYVTSDNRIGTLSSSRRYKEKIKPMEKVSEAIHSLRPVSFRYKKEVDPKRSLSFGLIAEEVARVSPDLVTLDRDGKPETVRYEAINAMLLNEFLKEHEAFLEERRNVQKLEATVARQEKAIEALAADLEKVTSQVQLSKAGTRTIAEN
jgi:Chaperone of endosialidase